MIKLTPSIYDPKTIFHVICKFCKTSTEFYLDSDKIRRWQKGEFIQDVFPELDVNQRELLISQCCGKCFDEMWDNYQGDFK